MKKKFSITLLATLLLGFVGAFALDIVRTESPALPSRAEQAQKRADSPMAEPRKNVATARIKGGTASDKPLYGIAVDAYDGDLYLWYGPARIDAGGNHSKLRSASFDRRPFSGCYYNGKMLIVHHDPTRSADAVQYAVYDATTWALESEQTFANSSTDKLAYSLAYDPSTTAIYGCVYNNTSKYISTSDAQFARIDPQNLTDPVMIIGNLDTRLRAMACDKNGTLYGVDNNGNIYKVDKNTAALTKVAKFDFPVFYGDPTAPFSYIGSESGVIDWETGMFYMSYHDSEFDTYVAKFDPTTGVGEVVGNFGYWSGGSENCEMFTALYFEQQASVQAGGTPLGVTEMSATAVGTEMKATIKFTMPTENTKFEPLSGTLKWRVTDGSNTLREGSAAPGEKVETVVDVIKPGKNNFSVIVTASAESMPVSASAFIGGDTPKFNSDPTASVSGQKVTLRWQEPVGVNNSALASPLTYKITRQPGDVVVAEAATGLSYVDQIASEAKACYSYDVTPKAGNIVGETASTRSIYVGSYFTVPYTDSFTDATLFYTYPVIDNNNDDNTWEIDTKREAAIYASNGIEADDYLCIGPFKMTAGNIYTFKTGVTAHSVIERLAVYVGTDPKDVKSFNTELIGVTAIDYNDHVLTANYKPTADGLYYFGIKACSGAYTKNLYVLDVEIDELDGNAPGEIASISATPKAASADITFTLPSKSINGKAANVTAAKIFRDGQLLATVTKSVADGATLTYTDTEENVSRGTHLYSVSAVNSVGEGVPAYISVFRGLDIPGSPTNYRIVEDLNQMGLMHMTWDAPKLGQHGGYIDPNGLTYHFDYTIFHGGYGDFDLGKECAYDFQIQNITEQSILAGSVYASNSMGSDKSTWTTNIGYFGPALSLPYRESWPNLSQKNGYWAGVGFGEKSTGFWDINDGQITGKVSQDLDAGMLLATAYVPGGGHRILSPRVSLAGTTNPTMVFYYNYTPVTTAFDVEIIVDDQPLRTLRSLNIAAAGANKWTRVEIPLADYKNSKYVQFALKALASEAAEEFAMVDNVSIADYNANDLAVTDFSVPGKGNINERLTMTVTLRNIGANAVKANDFSVKLFKNNVEIANVPGKDIAPDAYATLTLTDTPLVTDPTTTDYYVEVAYAADGNKSDNTSARKSVLIATPVYPRVTDLQGSGKDEITLTWSDPSAADMPCTPVTETFENYTPFTIDNFGDWTMYDGDGCPTTVLALPLIGVLDYPNIGKPMAWQIMDPAEAGMIGNAWYARSGKLMLVSFQACKDGAGDQVSDDWLISPELFGGAQTISFYAQAAMSSYAPETMNIMYSTTGTDIDDFTALETGVEVPYTNGQWSEFAFTLPQGARYFAIVHTSKSKLALIVDDITFVPAGSTPEKIELQGFNVYRDGKKLNSSLVGDNEYVDRDVVKGVDYTYHVTAVWDKGESALSNTLVVPYGSALATPGAETMVVKCLDRAIAISGVNGRNVSVHNIAGQCVANVKVNGSAVVDVPAAGVYIVKSGTTAVKVIVK